MTQHDSASGGQSRRTFLQLMGSVGLAAGATSRPLVDTIAADHIEAIDGTVGALSFYSPASQLAVDGVSELADDDVALVRAESTAFNFETTDDGPETVVYDTHDIPVVSQDTSDPVVGFGSVEFVSDGNGGFSNENEMFLLNLFDQHVGPDSLIAWDESHEQFWTLDDYDSFHEYAEYEGYDVRSSSGLLGHNPLTFPSTASQIAPDGESPLTDSSRILVWAEPSATNVDNEDDGAVIYDDDDIPLVSREDNVVGFGTPEIIEDDGLTEHNLQFLLNLLDDTVGTSGTILWDDAHDTYYSSDAFQDVADAIADADYQFSSSGSNLLAGTEDSVLSIDPAVPNVESVHTWELEDVTFGQSGNDGDEVDEITVDYESASLDGLTDEDVTVTMTRTLSGGEDTTEISVNQGSYSGSTATFDLSGIYQTDVAGPVIVEIDGIENPAEAENATITLEGDAAPVTVNAGVSFSTDNADTIEELEFYSTASLIDPSGEPLDDADVVAVWAEETATNVEASGPADGDYLAVDSSSPGGQATHTWEFDDVDFDGEVDEITVDYPADATLDGLTNDDITVIITRELDAGPDTTEISVNSDQYSGTSATFDLSGNYTTDIVGETSIQIDGMQNPAPGDHQATITFTGSEDDVSIVDTLGIESVTYPDSVDIPLLAIDGSVVGIGSDFAPDASEFDENREFLVNVWEDRIDDGGTIRYDESHGQGLTLADYSGVESVAEDRGFTVEAITDDFAGALDDADGIIITTEDGDVASAGGYSADERDALADFVTAGGSLFLHDTSDFQGESTAELNEIVASVGAGFRFNADQVEDDDRNGGNAFIPRTSNFNDEEYPEFFVKQDTGGGNGPSLDNADVVMIPSPATPYTSEELDALESHVVDDGGSVFLFDESEFTNEETDNLNEIAAHLDLAFRFNPDQVEDQQHNGGAAFVPTTTNFNDGFDLFDDFETIGLAEADAVVIMTPDRAFSDIELDELADFVADDGAVFLFDESDFGGQGNTESGFDRTGNLNEIADRLDLDFRFNSDQINDEEHNTGAVFNILTANYDVDPQEPGVFAERDVGIGISFERDQEYFGQIVQVIDGDTFEIEFDERHEPFGFRDVVRTVGLDTPETPPTENDPVEWFGIPDDAHDHLHGWGSNATDYAVDLFAPDASIGEGDVDGRSVKISFDSEEPLRGNFGRLLTYVHFDEDFDADPDTGSFDVNYNKQTIDDAVARVYSSGFGRHDEFSALEEAALADRRGIWEAADFDALDEIRNNPVEDLYFPPARTIRSSRGRRGGRLDRDHDRVPVFASDEAEQELGDDGIAYDDDLPLVATDQSQRLALVGGVMIHEEYDGADDAFDADTSGYGNFPFLTNLIDYLGDSDGDVLIVGGQGQFNIPGSIPLERCQYYLRFIEGVGGRMRQINDVRNTLPQEVAAGPPRAVIITAPDRRYEQKEIIELRKYRNAGGAIILMGSADNEAEHIGYLNDLADRLNTDLQFNDDTVVDESNHLADDPRVVATDVLNDAAFPLFEAYDPEADIGGPGRGNKRGDRFKSVLRRAIGD